MARLCHVSRLVYGLSHAPKSAMCQPSLPLECTVPSRLFTSLSCNLLLHLDDGKNEGLHTVQKRCAGHSKWQNIKSTKEGKDAERSRIFSRISSSIKLALRDGSANPISNSKLARAMECARENNMPKASVNALIENSQKTMLNGKESLLEYRGLDGLALLVSIFTDNPKRAKGYINAVTKKYGFKDDHQSGSIRHMFKEQGLVVTGAKLQDKPVSFSEAEDHAIEVGAEEVAVVDDTLQFMCSASDLNSVRAGLQKLGYAIESSQTEFVPQKPVPVNDDKMESLIACVSKIEDLEEVVKVFVNAA